MSEKKKESQTLKVLLLVCAGALLAIVVTVANTIHDIQVSHAAFTAREIKGICTLPLDKKDLMPLTLQAQLAEQCSTPSVLELE